MKKKSQVFFMILAGLLSQTTCMAVGSSAFEVSLYSASSLAKANAVTASPEDPSTIAFNPAGLTKLSGVQAAGGDILVLPQIRYRGAATESSSLKGLPIPFTYVSVKTPIESLTIGFGANSLFGLETRYSSTGQFKYSGYFTSMVTESYHLSGGYKINDRVSVGGGLTFMTVDLKQSGKYNTSFLLGFPGLPDANYKLNMSGQAVGWNSGVLISPSEKHTFGLFFRSQMKTKLKGQLDSDDLGFLSAVFGDDPSRSGATTSITFPYNLTLGYCYKPTKKWDAELDVGLTGWSSYNRQQFTFTPTNAVLAGFEDRSSDFKDVLSIQLGASYCVTDSLSMKAGYYFYEMAANKNNYDNTIPDGNANGFTLGGRYLYKKWTVDLAYLFVFGPTIDINNHVAASNGSDISGKYSTVIHGLSLSTRYEF